MAPRDRAGHGEHRQGFTLLELLIALVIIGIIAAVAIPSYIHMVNKGHQVEAERVLTSLAQTAEIYRFQNPNAAGGYAGMTIAQLQNLGWVNDSSWYPTVQIAATGNNDPPAAGWVAPPDGSGALGPWFKATATGNIGGAQADVWTVTNNAAPWNSNPSY